MGPIDPLGVHRISKFVLPSMKRYLVKHSFVYKDYVGSRYLLVIYKCRVRHVLLNVSLPFVDVFPKEQTPTQT